MIPKKMRALEIRAYDGQLHLVEKPVPKPGQGEVLVQIAASPVNPSDLKFMVGGYGVKKSLPVVPGFEASGTVVATGSGLMPLLMKGKRVACMAPETGDGTWAEYMVANARKCIPLQKAITLEQGATMVVNPWTAWALLATARQGKHKAAVHTAAGSSLGRMMARLAQRLKFPIIHVVRRAEQVTLLRGLGAAHVLDSTAPDFDAKLKDLCASLGATMAFDPVAGEMTGRVLAAMPCGSVAVVYGSLSGQPCMVDPKLLLYEQKRVEGFWAPVWAAKQGFLGRARVAMGLQKWLATDLRTEVCARVPLEKAAEAIEAYKKDMSGGKVLIVPGEKAIA